tara:strand:+ start:3659 stop:4117 length:459 start_codon:yes stop_codon:yes gene_type:complete
MPKRCKGVCKNGKRCKNSITCRFHRLSSSFNDLTQKFRGEKHMLGRSSKTGKITRMSYCGPGTKLEKREKIGSQPINKVDGVCKKHDYAYARIGKANISDNEKRKQVREADKKMLNSLKNIRGWESAVASLAIKGKIGLETLNIIDKLKFID